MPTLMCHTAALGSLGLHYDRKEFGFLSAFGHVHISHLFATWLLSLAIWPSKCEIRFSRGYIVHMLKLVLIQGNTLET